MSFFIATVGELIIIQLCVLIIWVQVLMGAAQDRSGSIAHKKLLTTSLGLVFTAAAILGIMGFRVYEYLVGRWPFVWGITAFYVLLAAGGILFIITPALGGSLRMFRIFLALTTAWTAFVIASHIWSIV